MSTARHHPPAALLKRFGRLAVRVAYVISDRLGPEETTRFEAEAGLEFASLTPPIPYIGSRWLNNLHGRTPGRGDVAGTLSRAAASLT